MKINDKHFEVIVRQMMRKVEVVDAGDTKFLEKNAVNKCEFIKKMIRFSVKKLLIDAGDSNTLKQVKLLSARRLRDENSLLKRNDAKLVDLEKLYQRLQLLYFKVLLKHLSHR